MDHYQTLWDADEKLLRARSAFYATLGTPSAEENRQRLSRAKLAHGEIFASTVKAELGKWMQEQMKGMTNAEKIAFGEQVIENMGLGKKFHLYTIEENITRRHWQQRVGLEAFGDNLKKLYYAQGDEDITPEIAPNNETLASFARQLVWVYMVGAMRETFHVISSVWRAEPKPPRDMYMVESRRRSWEHALYENPKRYVPKAVYTNLLKANRIKENGAEWGKFSECKWSFRNPATIDQDISRATRAADSTRLKKAA